MSIVFIAGNFSQNRRSHVMIVINSDVRVFLFQNGLQRFIFTLRLIHDRHWIMRKCLDLFLCSLLLWEGVEVGSWKEWVSNLLLWYQWLTILVRIHWMILRKLLFFSLLFLLISKWLRTSTLLNRFGSWRLIKNNWNRRLPEGAIPHLSIKFVLTRK